MAVSPLRPARPGELLTVTVAQAAPGGKEIATSRVKVIVDGRSHNAAQITAINGVHLIQFVLDGTVPEGSLPLTVMFDQRISAAFALPVRLN